MPKIFEFRKVLAFRSILDSRFLKGKISQVVCLSIPLLFFPIQGCSTLPFYSADQPKSYVNLQTVKWAPEPDFYGDDALPGKKLTDHLLNHRKVSLEEELHPDRNDFLEELSRSFELDHYLDNRRVQQEISRLQQNPSYLESLQPRLERYLPFICEKVLSRNLPGELCLIPIIESSLDPFAFSSGGAAGLWQFIPSTAKRYGLKIDWWVDERRDLFASTDAALDYLVYLNSRFDDWLLTIASYNWGEGRVARARNQISGGAGFFDLRVPAETAVYIPRLLAIAAVFSAPATYNLHLAINRAETGKRALAAVDTIAQLDVRKAASAAGISIETLYQINPALNQWSTHPRGPHRLMVPAPDREAIQRALADIPSNERVSWIRHKILKNETLSDIALHYRTDVATLREANRMKGTRIIEGNYLLIPRSTTSMEDYPTPDQNRNSKGAIHVVRSGESLWTIAKRYRVTTETLIRANSIGPKEIIRPGRKVIIPPQQTVRQPVVREIRYKVKSGDSLATIARKFNLSVDAIASWNTLDPRKYIYPGQELMIYVNVTSSSSG